MSKSVKIDKSYPIDALEGLYRSETDGRMKERLLAMIHLYEGKSISQVSSLVKHCENTIRDWCKRWNAERYQGLKLELKGGPKAQMSASQWDDVAEYVKGKGMSIEDTRQYIWEHYQVRYGYHMVWRELREKRKVSYGKPFMINQKRPADAEEQLKKS
jgi:transposase